MSEITKQYQIRYNKEEVQLSDLFGVVRDLVLGMVASGAHPAICNTAVKRRACAGGSNLATRALISRAKS